MSVVKMCSYNGTILPEPPFALDQYKVILVKMNAVDNYNKYMLYCNSTITPYINQNDLDNKYLFSFIGDSIECCKFDYLSNWIITTHVKDYSSLINSNYYIDLSITGYELIWTNFDLINCDGTLLMQGTQPVPVYNSNSPISNNNSFMQGLAAGLCSIGTWGNNYNSVGGSKYNNKVGLVAVNTRVSPYKEYYITTSEQAINLFGKDSSMADLASLALQNGASEVVCVAIEKKDHAYYDQAFKQLCQLVDVGVLICDSFSLVDQQYMRNAIETSLNIRPDRVGIAGCSNNEMLDTLKMRASGLCSQHMILVNFSYSDTNGKSRDGHYTAACVAGILSARYLNLTNSVGAKLVGTNIASAASHTDLTYDNEQQLLNHGVSILKYDTDLYIYTIQYANIPTY